MDADECCALYDNRNQFPKEQSIRYEEGSNNLLISLFFKSEDRWKQFISKLMVYNENHPVFRQKITVVETICEYTAPRASATIPVFRSHCIESAADSLPVSVVSRATELEFDGDPEKQMRSLEDLSKTSKHELIYQCHIAPKAFYSQYRNDPNNILFGTHMFHSYFDGDGKRRPPDADLSWGDPPHLKLVFDSVGASEMYRGVEYFMIYVLIRFQDPEVARCMDNRWREGYSIIDDLTVKCYFYSTDVEKAKSFLALKQLETEERWRIPGPDDDLL